MGSTISFIKRIRAMVGPPRAIKNAEPLRFGILGAANIAPIALIVPCLSHPDAVVTAVAARSLDKAQMFAKKHDIPTVYGGSDAYQKLLEDPSVDVIYNPLPNGLHYEWTLRALHAGKHVLLEKPSCDTAAETQALFDLAKSKNLVLMEAFHYRFHPAIQRLRDIIISGELGTLKSLDIRLALPSIFFSSSDIRFDIGLGGGAMMDCGCYTMHCARYLSGATEGLEGPNPPTVEVLDAQSNVFTGAKGKDTSKIDVTTRVALALPGGVSASLLASLGMPPRFGIIPVMPQIKATAVCENGESSLYNFVMPTLYHSLTVKPKGGKQRVEKVYKFQDGRPGEEWWTTYRYMVEEFVAAVRDPKTPRPTWLTETDSVANLNCIEKVYAKTGFGSRPASAYVHS